MLMSVYPGYGGQKYIPEVNGKIRYLREKTPVTSFFRWTAEQISKNIDEVLNTGEM